MTSVRCFVLVMVVILIQSEVSFLQWKLTYVQKVTVRFFVSEVFFIFFISFSDLSGNQDVFDVVCWLSVSFCEFLVSFADFSHTIKGPVFRI